MGKQLLIAASPYYTFIKFWPTEVISSKNALNFEFHLQQVIIHSCIAVKLKIYCCCQHHLCAFKRQQLALQIYKRLSMCPLLKQLNANCWHDDEFITFQVSVLKKKLHLSNLKKYDTQYFCLCLGLFQSIQSRYVMCLLLRERKNKIVPSTCA